MEGIILTLYFFGAVVGSNFAATALEKKRLKTWTPFTRPYRWGFWFGCMGLACAPLAALSAIALLQVVVNGAWEHFAAALVFTLFFMVHALCGWLIIKRTRWAWVIATLFTLSIPLWVANGIYARNRWREMGGRPRVFTGTENEGYELLDIATNLEMEGHVQKAFECYERIAESYSQTAAGTDARKSIEALRLKLG